MIYYNYYNIGNNLLEMCWTQCLVQIIKKYLDTDKVKLVFLHINNLE